MCSLPDDPPKPKAFAQETKQRIQRIKNGLVSQVATEDGSFFDEVREVRAQWDIKAPTQLPPEDRSLLYPEQILRVFRGEANLTEQHIYNTHNWERDIKRLWLWLVVPGLERSRLDLNWWPFMAALVLFQPPLDRLLEFAQYGGIEREDPYGEYGKTLRNDPEFRRKEAAMSYDPMLVSPLISTFPDPYSLERAQQDYYETLMEEINKRFLKPRGLDIDEMRDEVLRDGTLNESLQERQRQISQDLYVEIPKHATLNELRKAVELAHSVKKEAKEEASAVEASEVVLIKAELAYRFYQLDQKFSDLPKKRYPRINSSETFKQYALAGRKLLSKVMKNGE